ncbi:2-dehydro-3-deoxyphosphooctonate aldolase [Leptobacterium flavescens]|uniref:2-dehydro-3-deoxyphosphooctonate aldolase n=1 Tax=Leptobacterium flavescens TaxID=472055 RepID=A0A6P0UNV7_9FLAO|nr:murein L,D-transpeptidase family protein [Leptobacterium flavescens]NER14657.1 2-dehydro-3-deoxyphosphooctonate aldolase [Leptobacterium flavescens]
MRKKISWFLVLITGCVLLALVYPGSRRYLIKIYMTITKKGSEPLYTEEEKASWEFVGKPVFIRIFKETSELELWVQTEEGSPYTLADTKEICKWSGKLGPKLKEGDKQSPEGFYKITKDLLNPNSSYHLSMNLGFPNAYDKAHDRTGSFLMIHGNCVSIGCYAITDREIEKLYTYVEEAQKNGQREVPVHIFPFRINDAKLESQKDSPWIGFWRNLYEGYQLFERDHIPPEVELCGKKYCFQ